MISERGSKFRFQLTASIPVKQLLRLNESPENINPGRKTASNSSREMPLSKPALASHLRRNDFIFMKRGSSSNLKFDNASVALRKYSSGAQRLSGIKIDLLRNPWSMQ